MNQNEYRNRCAIWILCFGLIWVLTGCAAKPKPPVLPPESFSLPPKPLLITPISNEVIAIWMLNIDQYANFCTKQMQQVKKLNEANTNAR